MHFGCLSCCDADREHTSEEGWGAAEREGRLEECMQTSSASEVNTMKKSSLLKCELLK